MQIFAGDLKSPEAPNSKNTLPASSRLEKNLKESQHLVGMNWRIKVIIVTIVFNHTIYVIQITVFKLHLITYRKSF